MPVFKEGDIFAAFRAIDVDRNGFLEWYEYQACLEKSTVLGLTKQEALTLNLLADLNGDGKIDY